MSTRSRRRKTRQEGPAVYYVDEVAPVTPEMWNMLAARQSDRSFSFVSSPPPFVYPFAELDRIRREMLDRYALPQDISHKLILTIKHAVAMIRATATLNAGLGCSEDDCIANIARLRRHLCAQYETGAEEVFADALLMVGPYAGQISPQGQITQSSIDRALQLDRDDDKVARKQNLARHAARLRTVLGGKKSAREIDDFIKSLNLE